MTAGNTWDWGRVLLRLLLGRPQSSPLVHTTDGEQIDVRLDSKIRYELDGGDRKKTTKVIVEVEPGAVTVCVPREE